MHKIVRNGVKNAKNQTPSDNEPAVIDFGMRKISSQNFSKIVALPKTALKNCGDDKSMQVKVQLVQQNGEKYLKLTPTCSIKGSDHK
ncbi:hypothetical protein [Candidatus Nitrosotenuis sp. DW1]|uniref:hypothetical protein n=1 Tax=Candidatus Nitrosotenuis sp. DW1 TaxID=2259672 RepID=UPI0015C8B537|nr:hypothetical protein [Candidatus Nitrosotenuis sp. DW1]QLH08816.1 hypothetical protein DSQ19_04350 [Candidatus Nitrosotenuis sp. DW1]